ALKLFEELSHTKSSANLNIINVLASLAEYFYNFKDYQSCIEYSLEALKIYNEFYYLFNENVNVYESIRREYNKRGIIKLYLSLVKAYQELENYPKALEYMIETLTQAPKILNEKDFMMASLYMTATDVYTKNGHYKKAFTYAKQAFENRKHFRDTNFTLLDSSGKYHTTQQIDYSMPLIRLFSIGYTYMIESKDSDIRELVRQYLMNAWINYKGEISNFNTIISIVEAQTDNQVLLKSIKKLKKLKRELSHLYQNFDSDNSHFIKSTEREISHTESELSHHSTQFKEFMGLQDITYKDIASHLKPNQLYIDFVSVQGSHYVFILDNECNLKFKSLFFENTHALNTKIEALQKELKKDEKRDTKPILQDIYQIFQNNSYSFDTKSLFDEMEDKNELIISPDGVLNFIPFEALHDGKEYLIESKTVSYISSAKEFIKEHRRKEKANSNTSSEDIVVFADADFYMQSSSEDRSVSPIINQKFCALDATQKEVDVIKEHYPNAKIYIQEDATVENLMYVQNPKILHIATHGFYLDDKSINNSLEKSGLALSAVPQAKTAGDIRGIVTSLKLSTMNLVNTDLVVLSACETGLGDLHNFDSVSSLASAFIQAGSKNVIMSLWKISDETTSKLIESFYDNIAQGKNYKDALREAKLQMIEQEPFYWSALILHGV
ncbi:MAG: CHAT domain-containing protein, partial [Campylobacterales bacterium]|nr:CHAT domain-containing protein [Campylobacterales bacterium]